MTDQIDLPDATVSDFLYVLRNHAWKAAERLGEQVLDMRKALGEAETVLARLNELADGAQDAAELVCASDLEPTASAEIPERSGLTRETIECPGCGERLYKHWADGWRSDNGFTCKPPRTVHTDHIPLSAKGDGDE